MGRALAVLVASGLAAGCARAVAPAATRAEQVTAVENREAPPRAPSLVEALAVPNFTAVRFTAYLLQHEEKCPPCPKDYQCEACLPPYALFGDKPPGQQSVTAWVDPSGAEFDLAAVPEGQQLIVSGRWAAVSRPGANRVLLASEFAPVAAAGQPAK